MNEITIENLTEWLDNLTKYQQMNIWNKFSDNQIYTMDELDELCYGMKVTDIIDRYGKMDTTREFWYDDDSSYITANECGDYPIDLMDIEFLVEVFNEQGMTTDKLAELVADL